MNDVMRVLIAAAVWACASTAIAADVRIIDFDEALRIALERNIGLRQAQTAAALSEVEVRQARLQFVPDLRATTSGAQNYGRNFNQSEGRVIDQNSQSVNLGLSSGVVLFDGFGNVAALREARLSRDASDSDVQRARETVVFQVAADFLALIQQREQLRVQRENLAAEAALEQQIQTYVDAGARTVADLYQQQANVASGRLSVVQAERAAELARVDLMQTLQLDPRGNYEFEAPEIGAERAMQQVPLQDLLTRALGQRKDLAAERRRIEAAEQSIRVARSGRWPVVSLNAGYSSGYTSAVDFPFTEQLDQRRGGSVNLALAIPIFDRGGTSAATRRAQLQAQSARIELDSLEHEIGLQVRRAELDYRAAQEQSSAAEAQLRAAELALESSQARYQAGAATLVELSQARASQVQAASAVVAARYNLLFQRSLMDYYLGELRVP
jgi:outer membrane protein